jgi:hypothetical protein
MKPKQFTGKSLPAKIGSPKTDHGKQAVFPPKGAPGKKMSMPKPFNKGGKVKC